MMWAVAAVALATSVNLLEEVDSTHLHGKLLRQRSDLEGSLLLGQGGTPSVHPHAHRASLIRREALLDVTRQAAEPRAVPQGLPGPVFAVCCGIASLLVLPICYYFMATRLSGMPPTLELVTWIVVWLACVLVMNVSNKRSVQGSPVALATLQMTFAIVVMLLLWPALELKSMQNIKDLAPWTGVCFFFALLICSSLYGFQSATISTVVMMGSLRPLYAHAIEWACFSEQPTLRQVLGCGLLMLGSAAYFADYWMSTTSQSSAVNAVSAFGLGALVLNGVVGAIDRCYQRYYLHHKPIPASKCALVLAMNFGGLIFVLMLLPWWKSEIPPLVARAGTWWSGEGLVDFAWVLLSCLGGVAIGFAGIGLQKVVTASGFLVCATGSRAALIAVDNLWLGSSITIYALGGLAIVIVGSVVHAMDEFLDKAKQAAKQAQQQEKQLAQEQAALVERLQEKPSA